MRKQNSKTEEQKLKKTADLYSMLLCYFAVLLLLCFAVALPAYASQGGEILPSGSAVRNALAGHDTPMAMTKDSVGNIIVTGFNGASGSENFYTVKFKADGTGIWWTVPYNGPSSNKDRGLAVAVDSNDDVIVTGSERNATNTNYDIYTVKYNKTTGAIESGWPKVYNGGANGDDHPVAIAVDQSIPSKIYIGGYTATSNRDDFVIISYNSDGTMNNTWGGAGVVTYDNPTIHGDDRISSIAVLSTGTSPGLAAAGFTWNGADFDGLTVKFNLNGTVKWPYQVSNNTGYNKAGDNRESIVRMDTAGNVIVAGYIYSGSNKNIHVMKLNKDTGSNTVGGWEKRQEGGYQDEVPGGLFVNSSYVYMAGSIYSGTTAYDLYIAKYDISTGELLESAIFNTTGGNDEIPTDITVNSSGEVFVTGNTINASTHYKDWLTAKYSANLNLLWSKTFDGIAGKNDGAVGLGLFVDTIPDPDKEYIYVAGSSDTNAAASDVDYYMIKYDAGSLNRPTGLDAETVNTGRIDLAWTDNSNNETGFKVERCATAGCSNFATIYTGVIAGQTTYQDTTVASDTIYRYRVCSYIASPAENSYYSEADEANTTVLNPTASTWIYTYDGSGNDEAASISAGPDLHPVVTGARGIGVEANDYYTIKINRSNATAIWKGNWDDAYMGEDDSFAVAVDNNNDVIVSGKGQGPAANGNPDIYTIKYLASGVSGNASKLWAGAERYSGTNGINEEDTAVAAAADVYNNVFVVGYGANDKSGRDDDDIYIIKYPNCSGSADPCPQDWAAIYDGGFGHDRPSGIVVDVYGNPYITGYAHNGTNTTFFTAKYCGATALPGCTVAGVTYTKGQKIWSKIYNGQGVGDNYATAIDIGPSGNIYVTGSATNTILKNSKRVFYTIKYNGQTGDVMWEKPFGDSAIYDYEAVSVKVDRINEQTDDGIIVAGTVISEANNHDFYVIRYNSDGGLGLPDNPGTWQRSILKPTTDDVAVAMAIDSSGNVCVAGNSGTDMLAVKLNYNNGDIIPYGANSGTWYKIGNPNITAAATSNNYGEMFIAGSTKNASNFDIVVFKCLGDTISVPTPFTLTPVAGTTTQQINLTWSTAMLPPSPAPTFTLQRKDVTGNGPWTAVTLTPNTVTTKSDTGLAADNNYCYSLLANSGGTNSRLLIKCKLTAKVPPVLDNPLTIVSQSTIDVSWDNTAGNLGYKLERSPDGSSGWTQIGGNLPPVAYPDAVKTGYKDTSLSAGTNYWYRVSVLNLGGYSLPSTVRQTRTDPIVPTLNDVLAADIYYNSVTVRWADVVGESGYRVEYCSTGTNGATSAANCTNAPAHAGNWTVAAGDTGAGVLLKSVTGLTAGTLYYFRLNSLNNFDGTTRVIGPSAVKSAKTRLNTPAIQNQAGTSTSQIYLEWTDPNSSPDQTSYTLEYASCIYGYPDSYCAQLTTDSRWNAWVPITGLTGQSTTINSLTSGRTYRFRVTAVCAAPCSDTGSASVASTIVGATTKLTGPTLTQATPQSNTQIYLQWNDVLGETSFDVVKDGTPMALSLPRDTPRNTTVGSLSSGTTYCFKIRAINTVPDFADGNEICAKTLAAPPTLISVTAISNTQIAMTWSNETGETGYEVWETHLVNQNDTNKTTPASGWTAYALLATKGIDVTTHTHTVCPGDTYKYKVRTLSAPDPASGFSGELQTTTTAPPAPTLAPLTIVSQTQINLSWSTAAVDLYRLERCSTGTYGSTSATYCTNNVAYNGYWSLVTETTALEYVDSTRIQGTIYYYRVRGKIGCGYSALASSNISNGVTVPKTPTTLTATAQSTSVIRTDWAQTSNEQGYKILSKKLTAASCAAEYIEEDDTASTTITFVTPGTLVTKDFTGLSPGSTYCFRICAYNNTNMKSPYSSPVSRMTVLPQPQSLTATVLSETQVLLSWAPVTDNNGYKIERSLDNFATAPSFADYTAVNAVSYTDNTGLSAGTKYYYRIAARNGESTLPLFSTYTFNNTLADSGNAGMNLSGSTPTYDGGAGGGLQLTTATTFTSATNSILDSDNHTVEFDIKIIPYKGNDGWVEDTIKKAISCLNSNKLPKSGEDCDFCEYREAVDKALKSI